MKNQLKFTGVITHVAEPQGGTSKAGKEWSKIGFVVEEEGEQYPNSILFELFNKPQEAEKLVVGKRVSVVFDARATEYGGRRYNNLSAYTIDVLAAETQVEMFVANPEPPIADVMQDISASDDLPF